MKNGFTFKYFKDEEKGWFENESQTVVDRKRDELKGKGYNVSKIYQCLMFEEEREI